MTTILARPATRTITAVAVGLGVSLALPVLVHLVPVEAGPPLGARLLPIFYAVLVVALRFDAGAAFAVAVLAPLVNRWLTGMPADPVLPALVIELGVFTLLIVAARNVLPRWARFAGPVAYLVAAMAARSAVALDTLTLAALANTVVVAWPGLVMLLAIGAVAGAGVRDEAGFAGRRGRRAS